MLYQHRIIHTHNLIVMRTHPRTLSISVPNILAVLTSNKCTCIHRECLWSSLYLRITNAYTCIQILAKFQGLWYKSVRMMYKSVGSTDSFHLNANDLRLTNSHTCTHTCMQILAELRGLWYKSVGMIFAVPTSNECTYMYTHMHTDTCRAPRALV